MKAEHLIKKISTRKSRVGIIGLGYVGLPLAMRFCDEGFKTIGFDVDLNKINQLKNGISYINHIESKLIKKMLEKNFEPTSHFNKIKEIDFIIICVPTPLGIHNEPDLSYIQSTLSLIQPHTVNDQTLILESTTYPGTTEEEVLPMLLENGYEIGIDYFLGYSPEREDPGNKNFSTKNIPKVISGHTKECLKIIKFLYDQIIDKTVSVSSTRAAEMTKILENIHRAVNIGLVNELKIVADKMNIDIYEVINAAATKPFGFTPYFPGPGLGGHCIPIDPYYLTWKAKEIGMNTRFIELAGEINRNMPKYVIQKITEGLNQIGKSVQKSKVLILGLSYKKNVDDLRESPSIEIMDVLLKSGANVKYCDPYFLSLPKMRKYELNISSVEFSKESLADADIVVMCTDHDFFDYELIEQNSQIIVDTRGKFSTSNKKIIRA